jgi:hypothetical protein
MTQRNNLLNSFQIRSHSLPSLVPLREDVKQVQVYPVGQCAQAIPPARSVCAEVTHKVLRDLIILISRYDNNRPRRKRRVSILKIDPRRYRVKILVVFNKKRIDEFSLT